MIALRSGNTSIDRDILSGRLNIPTISNSFKTKVNLNRIDNLALK